MLRTITVKEKFGNKDYFSRDELACGSAFSAKVFLAGPSGTSAQLHYYAMTQVWCYQGVAIPF
jgi:hypothetical protein